MTFWDGPFLWIGDPIPGKVWKFAGVGSSAPFPLVMLAKHKVGSSTLLTRSSLKPRLRRGFLIL